MSLGHSFQAGQVPQRRILSPPAKKRKRAGLQCADIYLMPLFLTLYSFSSVLASPRPETLLSCLQRINFYLSAEVGGRRDWTSDCFLRKLATDPSCLSLIPAPTLRAMRRLRLLTFRGVCGREWAASWPSALLGGLSFLDPLRHLSPFLSSPASHILLSFS